MKRSRSSSSGRRSCPSTTQMCISGAKMTLARERTTPIQSTRGLLHQIWHVRCHAKTSWIRILDQATTRPTRKQCCIKVPYGQLERKETGRMLHRMRAVTQDSTKLTKVLEQEPNLFSLDSRARSLRSQTAGAQAPTMLMVVPQDPVSSPL